MNNETIVGYLNDKIPVYKGVRKGLYYYQYDRKRYIKGSLRSHITFLKGMEFEIIIAEKKRGTRN